MIQNWDEVTITKEFTDNGVDCYRLTNHNFVNEYYIVSEEDSRRLMNSPEVVGYEVYRSLLKSTTQMMGYLRDNDRIKHANVLSILRGALNYPMEESCYEQNICVDSISFMSCERVFDDNGDIDGLAVKYIKMDIEDNSTLIIGDIIASGDTMINCLSSVIDLYKKNNAKLRNIVIYTIGGTKAIEVLEKLTAEVRADWPDFQGISVVFYEGIFTCYEPGDKGVSGINKALIDFIWRGGIIAPAFRHQTLLTTEALFEKCIIYDGGARRYEIKQHIDEVVEFWEGLLKRADCISFSELIEEKLGHSMTISFDDWVLSCHYQKLEKDEQLLLYREEKAFIESLKEVTISEMAKQRLEKLTFNMKEHME